MLAKTPGAKKGNGIDPAWRLRRSGSGGVIDVAISPQQATISALLTTSVADIVNASSPRRGAAEGKRLLMVMKRPQSCWRAVGDINSAGTTIGAIVRGEEVLIAHDRTWLLSRMITS